MKHITLLGLLIFICAISCSEEEPEAEVVNTLQPTNPAVEGWLIPKNQVRDGGVGIDGIPSIDNPNFTIATEVDFLNPEDLILAIRVGDEIKAYPHPILDKHEIVNDRIDNKPIALTYCPLTGTGIGWNRIINDQETTFGVSGLLYNSNLMPYDRLTNSTWSQQRLDCVNGSNIGQRAELYNFIETDWSTWLAAYPESQVLNTDTGFDRDYQVYPYNDYRTNHDNIIFPVLNIDNRLPAKERVLGVLVSGKLIAFPFQASSSSFELIQHEFNNKKLLVARNTSRNYIVAFINRNLNETYTVLPDIEFPFIIQDGSGTKFDILGFSNDESNKQLTLADQFMGYWFSWGAFYPDLDLYEN